MAQVMADGTKPLPKPMLRSHQWGRMSDANIMAWLKITEASLRGEWDKYKDTTAYIAVLSNW